MSRVDTLDILSDRLVALDSAYYFLGCPLGLWLSFQHDFGLYGLWWGLNFALACAALLGVYLCLSTDWQKEVEKVMARLELDKAHRGVTDEGDSP